MLDLVVTDKIRTILTIVRMAIAIKWGGAMPMIGPRNRVGANTKVLDLWLMDVLVVATIGIILILLMHQLIKVVRQL